MLIALIVLLPFIASAIYIQLKETTWFGLHRDTEELAYKVWSLMWWGACIIAIFLSLFHEGWTGWHTAYLCGGSTALFYLLILIYKGIKRYLTKSPVGVYKEQTPNDIFRALNAVLQYDFESEDGRYHKYVVEYQGGLFGFDFRRNSPWVNIQYFNFKDCDYEHLHKAYAAANTVHIEQSAWTCSITVGEPREDGTPTINASMDYLFSCEGNLDKIVKDLREMIQLVFRISRKFSEQLDEAIKEQKEKDAEFFNNVTFNNKLATISRQLEARHTNEEADEDNAPFFLSVSQLVQLYEDVDLGCLLSLKIVQGDSVEHITDISAITLFDVRDYIRQHTAPTTLNSIVLIYEFEHQELFVNLTMAKGSTDNTLYYIVNVVRSGSELDKFMDNRVRLSSRTMLEVRLRDEDKDAWEVKYMIDDAMDKVNSGKENELTDEQRLAVAHTNPTIQSDLYWGKKYFNNRCYYQALYHFNRVFNAFRFLPINEWHEDLKAVFFDVSYYIGFIYADLGMNIRACYYLNIAKTSDRIDHIQEFINCLCNIHEFSALQFVVAYINDIREKMDANEAEIERLMPMFQFFQRRYLYLLVEYKKWDEAEKQANFMIKNDIDAEFAKGELEHIHEMREKDNTNK